MFFFSYSSMNSEERQVIPAPSHQSSCTRGRKLPSTPGHSGARAGLVFPGLLLQNVGARPGETIPAPDPE